ncbi:ROK family transcriptional regulator [Streptomyces coelicoflavus]|uniref:ROK family transcriptional regulator n=1 Tax=Streptomyces coelicoflavus TaxID=285562 RepID=UPI00367D3A11
MTRGNGPRANGDGASLAAGLDALRSLGSGTLSELAAAAGLSRQTMEGVLVKLASAGLVEHRIDSVLPHRAGGRPARLSRFRADVGYVVGVDLVGTTVKAALSDLSGRWVQVGTLRPPAPTTAAPDLTPVVEAVHGVLQEASVRLDLLRAVGVGTSGVARADGSMLTSPLIKPWTEGNVGEQLSEGIGAPVVMDNDLTLAAIAESRLGALRDAEIAVYVETFYSPAARIMIDGTVVRGRRRAAGELGALKAFAGQGYGVSTYFEDMARIGASLARLRDGTGTAADETERDRLADALAPPLAALALALDPELVALGGALGRYAEVLAPALLPRIGESAAGGPPLHPDIVGAQFVAEGVLAGAIDQAFEHLPERIYGIEGIEPPLQTDVSVPQVGAPVAAGG